MTNIILLIWIDECMSDSWRQCIIIPLNKKLSATESRNYQGTSLLRVTYKNGEWKTFIEEQFDPPHSEVTVGSRFGPTSTRHIVAVCLGAVTSPLWRGMN
ncbi:hypothetical protein RB195_010327 [Necator americanus]|uniref:Uncharacterized protein n=1 Tax=Necator americanus TaxID=51031 RepID=A0ABR1CZ89_NECAM